MAAPLSPTATASSNAALPRQAWSVLIVPTLAALVTAPKVAYHQSYIL